MNGGPPCWLPSSPGMLLRQGVGRLTRWLTANARGLVMLFSFLPSFSLAANSRPWRIPAGLAFHLIIEIAVIPGLIHGISQRGPIRSYLVGEGLWLRPTGGCQGQILQSQGTRERGSIAESDRSD